MRTKKQSPALAHVQHVWNNVSTRSWQVFNGAMYSAMKNAIRSGMKFDIGDFKHMSNDLAMGRWVGAEFDRVYSMACESNPSAVQAIEHYRSREPFIWAEKTKTPTRLHVGSEFTWKGERVTVTSFNDKTKSLTACSYVREQGLEERFVIGDLEYIHGGYRNIEAITEYPNGTFVARFSAKVGHERETVKRRFAVTLDELKTVRKDYDTRRRTHEKAIAAATTLDEVEAARVAAAAEGTVAYRHFDIEILNEAITSKRNQISETMSRAETRAYEERTQAARAANLERWANGEDVRDFIGAEIRVRVKGGFVEVSNGNKVSIEAARTTLAFVKRYRAKGWETNGTTHDVDAFQLRSVSSAGVEIGCTLIPWNEVDRCAELLSD